MNFTFYRIGLRVGAGMAQCLRQIFHSPLPQVAPERLLAESQDNCSPLLWESQLEMSLLY